MKIIAGQARGRNLFTLAHAPHVRPILARIKKSLFDILQPRLPGARFLDLYSGTGPVGLEALSRGASQVTFVEQDLQCISLIRKNVNHLQVGGKVDIFRLSALGKLSFLPKPYDIIFMGPPYKDSQKNALQLVNPTLQNIDRFQLLSDNGIIVAQHHKKEPIVPPAHWAKNRTKQYGDSVLSFFIRIPHENKIDSILEKV